MGVHKTICEIHVHETVDRWSRTKTVITLCIFVWQKFSWKLEGIDLNSSTTITTGYSSGFQPFLDVAPYNISPGLSTPLTQLFFFGTGAGRRLGGVFSGIVFVCDSDVIKWNCKCREAATSSPVWARQCLGLIEVLPSGCFSPDVQVFAARWQVDSILRGRDHSHSCCISVYIMILA